MKPGRTISKGYLAWSGARSAAIVWRPGSEIESCLCGGQFAGGRLATLGEQGEGDVFKGHLNRFSYLGVFFAAIVSATQKLSPRGSGCVCYLTGRQGGHFSNKSRLYH
ncbi:unnamed protein product [Tetraodon nigroviridis]|uniref:Chromosome 19 SCAF14240, whole genome shotgun sequence n=1 Tax=Tetraodon nigroviridis TaxID=99883 RepID=Q4STE3_TETNG|nr:unnamed protein product [Tetraodon nigroviridis]